MGRNYFLGGDDCTKEMLSAISLSTFNVQPFKHQQPYPYPELNANRPHRSYGSALRLAGLVSQRMPNPPYSLVIDLNGG
jgi:hypothetical protein